jgi:hypothetical protein
MVFAALVFLTSCSLNKPGVEGLKSKIEQKTGMKLTYGEKNDSTQVIYYTLTETDIANNRGNYDSIRSACKDYFDGNSGTPVQLLDNIGYCWDKDGFYVVLMSGMTKDSTILINLTTSTKPILADEKAPH